MASGIVRFLQQAGENREGSLRSAAAEPLVAYRNGVEASENKARKSYFMAEG